MSIFPTKILLATDGSREAELAAKSALGLAKQTGSELHVVHVLALPIDTQDPSSFEPEVRRQLEERARARVDEMVGTIEADGGEAASSHLRVGHPDAEIIDQAEQIKAGLIVMGSRGRGGIRRALMGSVSDSVVRHAHCPVMVVRGEATEFPNKILLATDGSEEAELAARTAADLAQKTDSELHVVHVLASPLATHDPASFEPEVWARLEQREQKTLEDVVGKIEASGGKVEGSHHTTGRPDEEIVVLGQEIWAGLIVTGSRGLGGIRRALMGSVSESVVRHSHCPVLVVRPER